MTQPTADSSSENTPPLPYPGQSSQVAGPLLSETRLGPYRLLQKLGEGGMGVVHLGLDSRGRAVAVKVLRDHIAHDADARARLAREVDTLSRVEDPAVAPIIDADVDGPRPYIVTRYVPGPSLDRLVAEHGPLTGPALVRLAQGLFDALVAIHGAGVIHRDLKPANVLMLDGSPVVIDFGIAHIADDIRLTMTGMIMGTPGYLSPELLGGGQVTEATDWWGWAATLAFAAQGRAPFGGGPMDAVIYRVRAGQADLSGVDPRLSPLLAAALHPDSGSRPPGPVILEALRHYALGGDTTQALPTAQPMAGTVAQHDSSNESMATQPIAAAEATQPVATTEPIAATEPADRANRDRWVDASPAVAATAPQVLMPTGRLPQPTEPPGPPEPTYAGFSPPPLMPRPGPDPMVPPRPEVEPVGWARPPAEVSPPGAAPAGMAPPAGSAPPTAAAPPAAVASPGNVDPWAPPPQPAPRQLPPARVSGGPLVSSPPGRGQPGPGPSVGPVSTGDAGRDPRIGRANRTGTLMALAALCIAAAAFAPLAALIGGLVWSTLARTADRTVTALTLKRYERGVRSSDVPLALLASPVRLLSGLVSAVVSAVLPLLIAVAAAYATSFWAPAGGVGYGEPHGPLALAVAATVAVVLSWWGAGGTSLRRGSRSLVRGLAPGTVGAVAVSSLLLAGAGYLAIRTQATGATPIWWPLQESALPWPLNVLW